MYLTMVILYVASVFRVLEEGLYKKDEYGNPD